jgi:hypothetical protein
MVTARWDINHLNVVLYAWIFGSVGFIDRKDMQPQNPMKCNTILPTKHFVNLVYLFTMGCHYLLDNNL